VASKCKNDKIKGEKIKNKGFSRKNKIIC
jgi:hypothetical protein